MKKTRIHFAISLLAYGLFGYGLGMYTSGKGGTGPMIFFISTLVIFIIVMLTSLEIVKKFLSDKESEQP